MKTRFKGCCVKVRCRLMTSYLAVFLKIFSVWFRVPHKWLCGVQFMHCTTFDASYDCVENTTKILIFSLRVHRALSPSFRAEYHRSSKNCVETTTMILSFSLGYMQPPPLPPSHYAKYHRSSENCVGNTAKILTFSHRVHCASSPSDRRRIVWKLRQRFQLLTRVHCAPSLSPRAEHHRSSENCVGNMANILRLGVHCATSHLPRAEYDRSSENCVGNTAKILRFGVHWGTLCPLAFASCRRSSTIGELFRKTRVHNLFAPVIRFMSDYVTTFIKRSENCFRN